MFNVRDFLGDGELGSFDEDEKVVKTPDKTEKPQKPKK